MKFVYFAAMIEKLPKSKKPGDLENLTIRVSGILPKNLKFDKELLAYVIRHRQDHRHFDKLLNAVADALDHPQARFQLTIEKRQRSKPTAHQSRNSLIMAMQIHLYVEDFVARGTPKDAAVSEAENHFKLNRSTIYSYLADAKSVLENVKGKAV